MTIRTLREVLDELENAEEGKREAEEERARWTLIRNNLRCRATDYRADAERAERRALEAEEEADNAEDARADAEEVAEDLTARVAELEEEATYLRMIS